MGGGHGDELRRWLLVRVERAPGYLAWRGYGFGLVWCGIEVEIDTDSRKAILCEKAFGF